MMDRLPVLEDPRVGSGGLVAADNEEVLMVQSPWSTGQGNGGA